MIIGHLMVALFCGILGACLAWLSGATLLGMLGMYMLGSLISLIVTWLMFSDNDDT